MQIEAPNWGQDKPERKPVNYYAPYSGDVLDDTELTFGPYAGLQLIEVPASWLLWYRNEAEGVKNWWLLEYIELRLEAMQAQAKQEGTKNLTL